MLNIDFPHSLSRILLDIKKKYANIQPKWQVKAKKTGCQKSDQDKKGYTTTKTSNKIRTTLRK